MVIVVVSLGRTPGYRVSLNCGAASVGDTFEVEGENTERSLCRARYSGAGGPENAGERKAGNVISILRAGPIGWARSRSRPSISA